MRTPMIAGNWKMHKTLEEARALVNGIRAGAEGVNGVEIVVCPPAQLLFPIADALRGSSIKLGAQNAFYEKQGAYTGEISVPMLKDAGCTHVIIGHSERRQIFGEDGPLLAKKVRAVVGCGLTVIYCVGETLEERESGRTQSVVERHINVVIDAEVPPELLIVAYEPVWAIGTGRTATPEQAQEVHAFIRLKLATIYGRGTADSIRILYGGSVKPGNAAKLLEQPDVDGALVGGACLVADDFVAIMKAAVSAVAARG
jgi:triosephosphate isomerase